MAKITISKILDKANQNFDAVTTKIATNVQSATKKELAKETSSIDEGAAFTNWKAQFGTPLGDSFTIPSEVYAAVAKQVSAGINDSVFEKSYSLNESQTIQTVANQIGTILNQLDPITVPVTENGKKVNYVVEFTGSGLGQNVFTVRKGNLRAILTSKNSNINNWKKAMAKYCVALYQLEHDAINKVKKECLKIFATNTIDAVKTVIRVVAENTKNSDLKKILTAVGGSDTDSELKKFLNSSLFKQVSSEYLQIEIKNALNNDNDKTKANSFDSYQTFTNYYNNLVDAVANNRSESDVKKAVNEFNALAKSMLGGSFVKVPYPEDDVRYSKDLKSVTIPSSYGHYVYDSDYESKVQKIYATSYTTSVNITGNKNANIISSGSGSDIIYGGIGKDTIYGGAGNDTIYGENDADKLYGDAGDDMLSGGDKDDSLYGGDGNDSLYGDKDKDKLFGDGGNDTLIGGLGNDTLTGGSGQDVFVYGNGDGTDTILDYVSGEDKIKISSGSVSSYSVSGGKDAVLKVGKGKITLKGVGNNRIEVITANNTTVTYGGMANGLTFNKQDLPKATSATINSNYSGSFDAGAYGSLATVDASSRTNSISIVGNKKANKLYGGSGGDVLSGCDGKDTLYGNGGNDTLVGDKGNDTLTGGSGKDVFYYSNGDGEDVIADFTENEDKIYITGVSSVTGSLSKNDVKFKVGNKGNIKVQNAKDKEITIAYSNGTEKKYVNGVLSNTSNTTSESVNYNGVTVILSSDTRGTFTLNEYNNDKTVSNKAVNIDATSVSGYNSLYIYGNDSANVIKAGTYYNYIYGGKGDDHLYSGNNNRTYFYYTKGDGNDTIYNLKNGDEINLTDCSIKNFTTSDSDVILNLDDGSKITLKNSLNKSIYFGNKGIDGVGSCYRTFAAYNISSNTFTLGQNAYGNFDLRNYNLGSNKAANIDATSANGYNSLYIYGNDSANVIKAGTYYNYIYGGKGDDHLYSGNNNRTYFYYTKGDGNDTIYNLKNGDEINLTSVTVKNITHNTSDIFVNLDDGSKLTLKNSANKNIYISGYGNYKLDTSNSSTSARVAEEYWFAEDDNFVGDDTSVDSIMEENYAVTNIETSDFNSLTNDEFNLTYSQTEDQK